LNKKLTLWDLYSDQGWTSLILQWKIQHLHREVGCDTKAHIQLCRLLMLGSKTEEAYATLPAMHVMTNTLNFPW